MADAVAVFALLLLVVAVVASFVPTIPAGVIALAAIYLEYFFGPDRMHLLLLASFTVVGLLATGLEVFRSTIRDRTQPTSKRGAAIAVGVGALLFIVAGPIGLVLGIFLTLLYRELQSGSQFDVAWDNAIWRTLGLLASTVAIFLLTLSMLLAYVVFVLWLQF